MYFKVIDMDDGMVFAFNGEVDSSEEAASIAAKVLRDMGVQVHETTSDHAPEYQQRAAMQLIETILGLNEE